MDVPVYQLLFVYVHQQIISIEKFRSKNGLFNLCDCENSCGINQRLLSIRFDNCFANYLEWHYYLRCVALIKIQVG